MHGFTEQEVYELQVALTGTMHGLGKFELGEDVQGEIEILKKKRFFRSPHYTLIAHDLSSKDVMELFRMYQIMKKTGKLKDCFVHVSKERIS